jgi:hypothetical protein
MLIVQNDRDAVLESLLLSSTLFLVMRSLDSLESHTLYLFNV